MKHVMVDLETLSTGDNAAIVQIAACMFDPEEELISSPEGSFARYVRLDSKNLGEIDGETLSWWLKGDPAAMRRVFHQGPRITLNIALTHLRTWLELEEPDYYWANSPNFDLRILRQAYERCNKQYPIPFRKERDFRTLKAIGRRLGIEAPPFVGVPHDALDDCFHQANHAIMVLRELHD